MPRQADQLASAERLHVLEIDARTAVVCPAQMCLVVKGDEREPGFLVAGEPDQFVRLLGSWLPGCLGYDPQPQPAQVVDLGVRGRG